MRIIRNLITYKAALPAAAVLAEHLAEKLFSPVLETHQSSSGFIPNPHTEKLVSDIAGGYSFRFRREEKSISKRALALAVSEQAKALEIELKRELTKEESATLKETLFAETLNTTLPERTEIDAFYHIESRTLLLPTTSKNLAACLVYHLIEACGAVETSTIHVSDIKGGLTTRLGNYFRDEQEAAFAGFKIGDSVAMKGKQGKASFDLGNLDHARRGILEALDGGMQAERLALVHGGVLSFKLTKDFHLRGIEVVGEEDDETELESMSELWTHHAGVQVLLAVAAVNALCDLFGYKEPVPGAAHAAQAVEPARPAEPTEPVEQAEQASISDADDRMYAEGVECVRESGRASPSYLQRELVIGYNRAARMIERMETEGIVTAMASDGSREVL